MRTLLEQESLPRTILVKKADKANIDVNFSVIRQHRKLHRERRERAGDLDGSTSQQTEEPTGEMDNLAKSQHDGDSTIPWEYETVSPPQDSIPQSIFQHF